MSNLSKLSSESARHSRRLRRLSPLALTAILVFVAFALAAAALLGARVDGDAAEASSSQWSFAQPMSSRRSYIAASQGPDGSIYVAGGMVGETGRPLATFQRYDPARDSWKTLSPLPVATRAAAAAFLAGQVYVVGGQTDDGDSTRTHVYDVRAGSWRQGPPLPKPRFNHEAVVLDDRLYVLGGYHQGEELDEVYVHVEGGWLEVTRLPEPIHAFGAVAYRGELWVVGGRRGQEVLDEVWIYDPGLDRWREGPPMPKPMELLGAAVHRGKIHAVWESTYQIYDGQRWRQGPTPRVTRHALSVFTAADSLYAIGGCTTALKDSPVVERLPLSS